MGRRQAGVWIQILRESKGMAGRTQDRGFGLKSIHRDKVHRMQAGARISATPSRNLSVGGAATFGSIGPSPGRRAARPRR